MKDQCCRVVTEGGPWLLPWFPILKWRRDPQGGALTAAPAKSNGPGVVKVGPPSPPSFYPIPKWAPFWGKGALGDAICPVTQSWQRSRRRS